MHEPSTYRVGGSWKKHTIVLVGSGPPDERGRRLDDRPVGFIDSAAPEGLAEQICALLNGESELRRAMEAVVRDRNTWCQRATEAGWKP